MAVRSECADWVAKLVSVQGSVEWQSAAEGPWQSASLDLKFCNGERIRTLNRSRATLQLRNETFIPMGQLTTVSFSEVKPEEPSLLDLLIGTILVRSRTQAPMKIRTPFINAVIKGTEFLVKADDREGKISVLEGQVEAGNSKGQVSLTDGQTALARRGEAPRTKLLIRPQDAVQWALYYPPLIDVSRLRKSDVPAIRRAAARYLAGDVSGALAVLEAAPGEPDGIKQGIVRAALLLSVGRVDEAEPLIAGLIAAQPRDGEPIALQSMIALARTDKTGAAERAERAVKASPESPVAWTALSYVQQARFDLQAALASAERAAGKDPENALAQARLAELYASLDRRRDAERAAHEAIRIAPDSARARTVLGFTQLMAMKPETAEQSFRLAIRLDSHDPLSRFGLGLAEIRQGDLEEGTADLEIAASLDPNDAMMRSYLGKAYYEQKRGKLAERQFSLAKKADSADPTPWFYDAIKKQTENRPVEALYDFQKAIELNEGRAVFRSRQLLDDDLAARSAALGRIYNDLGFGPRALVEGWKAVATDPANFSAHRLLADSYAVLPGQEVARASELLQSQLLQPINSTPIQPHLAESRLLVPQFTGPALLSFNEFNPIFSRNGFRLQATGLVGNLGTYGNETVHSGIWDKFSYSLGQFHYQTDGFRSNNDLKQDIYNAFAQLAVTPELSVQAEYRHRELEHGDLFFRGKLFREDVLTGYDPELRRAARTDVARFGSHYMPTPNSDVIFSLVYFDYLDNINSFSFGDVTKNQRGFFGEAQYHYRHGPVDAIMGAGHQAVSAYFILHDTLVHDVPFSFPFNMDVTNGYLYSHIRFPEKLTWTLGLSVDASSNRYVGGRNQINPKFGFLWEPTNDTVLRFAAFRAFTRATEVDATLEPTQIAGFNQFFDGWSGIDAWRYGVGLDHRFSPSLLMGAEASQRDLTQPIPQFPFNVPTKLSHQKERLLRAYADWVVNESLIVHAEYRYEGFSIPSSLEYKNHIVPVGLNYFHPSGLGASAVFTYVNQNAYLQGPGNSDASFGLVDLALRYRLPYRYGLASLMVGNVLDHKFDFIGRNVDGNRTGRWEETPLFLPDRTISLQLTLAF